jgi:O-methyltransferase involved in polyketide biosynthesis
MTTSKQSLERLTGVAETLAITLYARLAEAKRPDCLLKDEKALEIAQQINYDFEKYSSGWTSQLGCILRIKTYDEVVRQFLSEHPDAVILNLGAGLCTRFSRLDNGIAHWYAVDFPEVIEVRRQLMPESNRQEYIASSILDFDWMNQVNTSGKPILAIAEGVCPYLTETENRSLFKALGDRFPGTEFLFDMLNTKTAASTKKHDTVSKTKAEFKFGIDRVEDLESWGKNYRILQVLDLSDLMGQHVYRMPLWAKILSPLLKKLFKTAARSIKMQLG